MTAKTGKLLLAGVILALGLRFLVPVMGLTGLAICAAAVYVLKDSAGAIKGDGLTIKRRIFMLVLLAAVFGTSLYYRQLYRAFKLPSASMVPSIRENEGIMVDRKAYAARTPQRGDIIVFEFEQEGKKTLECKRVVGLPAESVEIKEGRIYINGVLTLIPELPAGISYVNAGDFGKQGQAFAVPADGYYVLGDNPAVSLDSRYFGFLNKRVIYGKVLWTYTGIPLVKSLKLLLPPA